MTAPRLVVSDGFGILIFSLRGRHPPLAVLHNNVCVCWMEICLMDSNRVRPLSLHVFVHQNVEY